MIQALRQQIVVIDPVNRRGVGKRNGGKERHLYSRPRLLVVHDYAKQSKKAGKPEPEPSQRRAARRAATHAIGENFR